MMSDFAASPRWSGSRSGLVFKTGERGLGYYKDRLAQTKASLATSSGASESGRKRTADAASERADDAMSKRVDPGNDDAEADDDTPIQPLDSSTLKQMLFSFEKKINRNQEMRMKHPGDPQKFMQSEIELNDELSALFPVAAAPELYPLFVSLGAVKSVLGVLAHENTDVSLAAVSLLQELTDPDNLVSADQPMDHALGALLDALVAEQGLELIVQNLTRLDETQEEDSLGVGQTFTIVEHLVDARPALADDITRRTDLLALLLKRIAVAPFDANKLHASEILAILLQSSVQNQTKMLSVKVDGSSGMEVLLQIIFQLRKTVPSTAEEGEFIENVFLCLRSALLVEASRQQFLTSEGFELMLKCLKQEAYAATCVVKCIGYAISGSLESCVKLVEVGGLKYLFPLFMGKNIIKNVSKKRGFKEELEETAVTIVSELCCQLVLSSEQETLQRLVSKFHENSSEKAARCAELFGRYSRAVSATELELAALRREVEEAGDDAALEDFDDEGNVYSRVLTIRLVSTLLALIVVVASYRGALHTSAAVQSYRVRLLV